MGSLRTRPQTSQAPLSARTGNGPAPTAAPVAATAAANVDRSTFEATPKAAAKATPGSWRGGPDTEVGKAISAMLDRLRASSDVTIKGDTAESLFTRAILDNRHVTNEQLLAMGNVTLDQLADSPKDRKKTLDRIPDARELPSHKMTVAMLAAVTGIDPKKLSEATPSLGMTGAANTPLLFAPKSESLQRSTVLHDFTDYLRGAGVKGLNKAVWGVENRILSALVSLVGGGRY